VECVTDRVDPAEADGDVYVGLEHLDAESLKIRRWGTPADVIGQKLRFRKGDIIFGKRRAYQRKLAVAEFGGICSAHAMVVRAKPDVVLPEFLPFLMQSDTFMERAVAISIGSLSPTINWTTLKVQEFPLPPKDEQRRIAEILWAADEATESWRAAEAKLSAALAAALNAWFPCGIENAGTTVLPSDWHLSMIGELVDITTGGTPDRKTAGYWGGSIPWIKTGEVNYADITSAEETITEEGLNQSSTKIVPAGSILMALYGQGPTLGRVAYLTIDAAINQACAALLPSDKVVPRFLFYFLLREYETVRRLARGATQPNINARIVRGLPIPICPLEMQRQLSERLQMLDSGRCQVAAHGERLLTVSKTIREQFVTGETHVQ
jgi:type I restriction enzyme S subunit